MFGSQARVPDLDEGERLKIRQVVVTNCPGSFLDDARFEDFAEVHQVRFCP